MSRNPFRFDRGSLASEYPPQDIQALSPILRTGRNL